MVATALMWLDVFPVIQERAWNKTDHGTYLLSECVHEPCYLPIPGHGALERLPTQARVQIRERRTCLSCFQNAGLSGISMLDIQRSAGGKYGALPVS